MSKLSREESIDRLTKIAQEIFALAREARKIYVDAGGHQGRADAYWFGQISECVSARSKCFNWRHEGSLISAIQELEELEDAED